MLSSALGCSPLMCKVSLQHFPSCEVRSRAGAPEDHVSRILRSRARGSGIMSSSVLSRCGRQWVAPGIHFHAGWILLQPSRKSSAEPVNSGAWLPAASWHVILFLPFPLQSCLLGFPGLQAEPSPRMGPLWSQHLSLLSRTYD